MAKQPKHKPAGTYGHASATRKKQPTAEQAQTAARAEADEQRPPFTIDRAKVKDPVLAWERQGATSTYQADGEPTEVEFTSRMLYTREKVHPLALRNQLAKRPSGTLFDDFNHMPADAGPWDFYKHDHRWQNRLIHGDSADVMRTLIDRDGLRGQVQCVYFDPPYGIGYQSNFATDANRSDNDTSAMGVPVGDIAPIRAFKDAYERQDHSFLDGIHERLTFIRELLADTGSVFVQIGDDNVHRMALVLDEVFGSENRVATITWQPTGSSSARTLPEVASYLLWYAKNLEEMTYNPAYGHELSEAEYAAYASTYLGVEHEGQDARSASPSERRAVLNGETLSDKPYRLFRRMPLSSESFSPSGNSAPFHWAQQIGGDGRIYYLSSRPPSEHMDRYRSNALSDDRPTRHWRVSTPTTWRRATADDQQDPLDDWETDCGMNSLARQGRLIASGSRLEWIKYKDEMPGRLLHNIWTEQSRPIGKRYPVQTSDKIVQRCILMASNPGDLVLDPTCGSGVTADIAEKWGRRWIGIDVSLVSIAVARRHMSTRTYDWYATSDGGDDPAAGLVCETMPRVSAATLAYGTTDLPENQIVLNDRPEKVRGKVRLCGPFTVESWSPYKVLGFEDDPSAPDAGTVTESVEDQTLDAALAEGGWLHSTEGARLLRVESVESVAAKWVTRRAVCETPDGDTKDAYVAAPGPTVSVTARYASLACEEMLRIAPSAKTLLLVSPAFDPDIPARIGGVDLVKVSRSRSSAMPGLKNRNDSADDLVILAEPSVSVKRCHGENTGKLCLQIEGYDIYDPSTGQAVPGEAGNIVCWMADIDHDGQQFFSHLTHFPNNARKHLNKIGSGLGRDLDPDALDCADGLMSQPFAPPEPDPENPHRIAIKIITTAGVELNTRITSDEIAEAL